MMQIAIYRGAFPDFDYVKLANDCGIKNAIFYATDVLVVVASPEAIATLSNNLDFQPEIVQELVR